MTSLNLAGRTLGPIASSSRTFASTSTVRAAVGAKPKKVIPTQQKKKVVVIRRDGDRSSGGGGGGQTRHAKASKLDYTMASPAPTLSDLALLNAESIHEENIGQPTVFPDQAFKAMKPFGLPRGLDKELSRYGPPASVVREVTVGMSHVLQHAASNSSADARYLLSGHGGSGKSFLLLQTVCQALATGWIVLYVPRAFQWINSSYPYEYDPTSQTFHQPSLALEVLQTLASVNGSKLSQIPGPEGFSSLAAYAQSIRKEEFAVKGLEQVMASLAEQKEAPVLLAFDDVHTWFMKSRYRSPDYKLLEAYSMSMPLLMLDFISGRKVMNRGMVLSAPSYSTTEYYPTATFEHALELPSDRHLNAYDKLEPTHFAHASSGIKKIDVPFGMTTKEAAGMFEIWTKKGIVRRSTDETFMGTYAAAAGNPKEMRRGVHLSIQAYNHSPAGLH